MLVAVSPHCKATGNMLRENSERETVRTGVCQ